MLERAVRLSKYGTHGSMRPLAALLAILTGSAVALASGLLLTRVVILFLPADEARTWFARTSSSNGTCRAS